MFVNQADLWFASKKTDGILDFSFEKSRSKHGHEFYMNYRL